MRDLDMKRIIVTGGAGFVGSAVVRGLAARGLDVAALDIANPGVEVEWCRADILDSVDLAQFLRGADAVCHLAAVGDVYEAARDPVATARLNVEGTARVVEAAAKARVPSIVYASTWEVYGPPIYQPVDENHPCSPKHPYSITKLAGETICKSLSEQ